MRDFRALGRHSRAASVAIVASYTVQVLAAIGFGTWLLQGPQTGWTIFGVVLTVVFIGTRLRGFNNIVHECSHASFSERREDNRRLGSYCASFTLGCFHNYRDDHMTHHAHLGDMEHDEDLKAIRRLHLEDPLTPATILRHVLTPLVGLHLPYYFKINMSKRDGLGFLAMKIAILVIGAVFLVVAPVPAFFLYWLPLFWVFPSINYWTDCVDHGGLFENGSELESSRNMVLPKAIRTFLFPRNDCFHLVHHLFPLVPSHHLEQCHEKLMTDVAYREANTSHPGMAEPVGALRQREVA